MSSSKQRLSVRRLRLGGVLVLLLATILHMPLSSAQERTAALDCEKGLQAIDAGLKPRAIILLTHALGDASDTSLEPTLRGRCALALGHLQYEQDDLVAAAEAYQRAVDAFTTRMDAASAAAAWNGLGRIARDEGRYSRAADSYGRAATLAQQAGDDVEYTRAQAYGAEIDALQDRAKPAITLLQTLVTSDAASRNQRMAGELWYILGSIQANDHDFSGAASSLARAIQLQQTSGDAAGQVQTLLQLAAIAIQQGSPAQAIGILNEAGRLGVKAAGSGALAQVQRLTAQAYIAGYTALPANEKERLGQLFFDDAMTRISNAYELARAANDRPTEMEVLRAIGDIHYVLRDVTRARAEYEQAADIYELLRTRAGGLANLTARTGDDVYTQLIRAMVAQGDYVSAFDVIERSRSRAMLDELTGIAQTTADPELTRLLDRERVAYRELRLAELQQDAARTDSNSAADAERAKADLEQRYRAARDDLRAHAVGRPLSAAEVQQALPPATSLLSYYFLDGHSLIAHVVSHTTVYSVLLPVDRNELNLMIRQILDAVNQTGGPTADDVQRINAKLPMLHKLLIAPLLPYVDSDYLIIAPHAELHYVPFAALTDGQTALLDRFAVSTVTSASTLPLLHRRPSARSAPGLVLGNPKGNLSYAEGEAEKVATLLGTSPLLLAQATRAAFERLAPDAGIIHIAADADFQTEDPLASAIALAPTRTGGADGALTIGDLYGLILHNTDLVVLSACRTNAGQTGAGDEFVSLSNAFLTAGSPSVLATLWPAVDGTATRDLMDDFYHGLQAGLSKAEALRQSQRAARDRDPNPYLWAGAVLIGDNGSAPRDVYGLPLTYRTAWIGLLALVITCFLTARAIGSGRRLSASLCGGLTVALVAAFVFVAWFQPGVSPGRRWTTVTAPIPVNPEPVYIDLPPFGTAPNNSSASAAGGVRIWDDQSTNLVTRIPFNTALQGLTFSPDGSLLAMSTDTVTLWPTAANSRLVSTESYGELIGFSPDGTTLLMAQPQEVRVWDVRGGAIRDTIKNPDPEVSMDSQRTHRGMVAFSLDRNSLIMSGFSQASVIDTTRGFVQPSVAFNVKNLITPYAVAVDLPGTTVAAADHEGHVYVWRGGRLAGTFSLPGLVNTLDFSQDSRLLIGSGTDGTVRIWDIDQGRQMLEYAHRGELSSLQQSPDGHYLVTAGSDGTVQFADLQSLQLLKSSFGSGDHVTSIALIGPNASRLATSSNDGVVRIWDLNKVSEPREEVRITHPSRVFQMAASPDGRLLATASQDGLVRLWRLEE